jgi:hypothetical protein
MRRSNDMDGVTFLDASVSGTGALGNLPVGTGKQCQLLGFATADLSSLEGDVFPSEMTPSEASLKWTLEQYPHGYSLDCDDANGSLWNEDTRPISNSSSTTTIPSEQQVELQEAVKDRAQHSARIKDLVPGIKSALFLPLWDFDRARWFAGCFCWSTRSERVLDGRLDLPFLKAFGLSIMQEVARLDSMATEQAKTTFLSSLSHGMYLVSRLERTYTNFILSRAPHALAWHSRLSTLDQEFFTR